MDPKRKADEIARTSQRDNDLLDMLFSAGECPLTPDGEFVFPPQNSNQTDDIPDSVLIQLQQLEHEAVAAAESEDLDAALQILTKAVELCPKYGSAYNNRAQVQRLKGNTQAALADIELAIQYGGTSTLKQAYTQRAILHKAAGNTEAADADFAQGSLKFI